VAKARHQSMRRKAQIQSDNVSTTLTTIQKVQPVVLPIFIEPPPYPGPAYGASQNGLNIIPDDKSVANVFCFGVSTNKITAVMYNNLTGNYSFMWID
jgi:hypothetical protein